MNGHTESFAGIKIIAHPLLPSELPKLMLHPDVPVTDEFRTKMNAWLLEMFGTKSVAFMVSGSLFASPKNVTILKYLTK